MWRILISRALFCFVVVVTVTTLLSCQRLNHHSFTINDVESLVLTPSDTISHRFEILDTLSTYRLRLHNNLIGDIPESVMFELIISKEGYSNIVDSVEVGFGDLNRSGISLLNNKSNVEIATSMMFDSTGEYMISLRPLKPFGTTLIGVLLYEDKIVGNLDK